MRGPQEGMSGARQNASSRLESMGLGLAGNPAMGAGKQPMGDVNYRAALDPARSCGDCLHFQAPEACELVAGNIDPSATCDLYEPATGAAMPATPVAPPAAPPAMTGSPAR